MTVLFRQYNQCQKALCYIMFSCKHVILSMCWGIFFLKLWTNVHSDSRMSWLDFGDNRPKFNVILASCVPRKKRNSDQSHWLLSVDFNLWHPKSLWTEILWAQFFKRALRDFCHIWHKPAFGHEGLRPMTLGYVWAPQDSQLDKLEKMDGWMLN